MSQYAMERRTAPMAKQDARKPQQTLNTSMFIGGPLEQWIIIIGLAIFAVLAVQIAVSMARTASPGQVAVVELLYLASVVAALLVRFAPTVRAMLLYSAITLVICLVLYAVSHGDASNVALVTMVLTTVTRLPVRYAIGMTLVITLIFIWTNGLDMMIASGHWNVQRFNYFELSLLLPFILIAAMFRSRTQAIFQLRAAQAQLRAEMEHTSELAAARERARIARDIHDVLAHSLTMLSVQMQAARLLDEMAALLRESMAESRQVVGLLREVPAGATISATLRQRLLTTAERFTERTGVKCEVTEEGMPRPLTAEQVETLNFALQEALTNAYRHGAATHLYAQLGWQVQQVTLTMRDDGTPQTMPAEPLGSGQGLLGMRERAEALGGTLTAGPTPENGFCVTMQLPLSAETNLHEQGAA